MHTPLLATLICRLHQLKKDLPRTQTRVFESAVLSMLEQTAEREMVDAPRSILSNLSPPHLQAAMQKLCKLAYKGLAKKRVVFKKSELEKAGCVGSEELGFLSSTPGVAALQGEDAYSFQHHTMLEFFAAVHAVREVIRSAKKGIGQLVEELGVDGNYTRFWPFVSGLLSRDECGSLLRTLGEKVHRQDLRGKKSRCLLLLLHCYMECAATLPRQGSPHVRRFFSTFGMRLENTHVGVSDAQAAAVVLGQYSSVITTVSLFSSSIDDEAARIFIAGLHGCTHLEVVNLDALVHTPGKVFDIPTIVERNKKSLHSLTIPASDADIQLAAPAVQKCKKLVLLEIGSPALSNMSAPIVADILRNNGGICGYFGLFGQLDDQGFQTVAAPLSAMGKRLETLALHWMSVSPALLSTTLSALKYLSYFRLLGCAIGDDGLLELAASLRCLSFLQHICLYNVSITCKSSAELEKLLLGSLSLQLILIICSKTAFFPAGQDVSDGVQQPTFSQLVKCEPLRHRPPMIISGFRISESRRFRGRADHCSKEMQLSFLD